MTPPPPSPPPASGGGRRGSVATRPSARADRIRYEQPVGDDAARDKAVRHDDAARDKAARQDDGAADDRRNVGGESAYPGAAAPERATAVAIQPLSPAEARPGSARVDQGLFLRASGRKEAAGRIIGSGLLCFALWTLFDANQLYHAALSSPNGARRTASLTFLRPIAAVSNALGLSVFVNWGDHMLGRGAGTPGTGGFPLPVPTASPQPRIPTRMPNGTAARPHIAGKGALPPPPPPDQLAGLAQPTALHPLTILDIGDSIGQDLGYGLGDTFTHDPLVNVVQEAVESTGLARPDYYDWPAELETYLHRYHPGVVVIMMGANDDQSLNEDGHFVPVGSSAWVQDYTSRVALLMNEAYSSGARVLWVGLPPMDSPNVSSAFARQVNNIFEGQAALHPDVGYFPSWDLLDGPHGQFTQYIKVDGSETQIRYPDGVHLTPQGWDLLGSALVRPMEQAWHVRLVSS